ncbi:hypothetical protein SUDANB9_06079 [Streptomyces sp. enrichment culture]
MRPVHLLNDGDTLFTPATGTHPLGTANPLALDDVLAAGVGTDDPSVFVASDVDLALSAGAGAGGELLDESFITTAQAPEDGDEGAIAGGGDHAGRVFARPGERPAR